MLLTKLNRPNLGQGLVLRRHLIQELDKNTHNPLALICAPSGYGKSVLACQWIETCNVNATWLSLDSEHQDLKIFLEYFIAALQMIIDKDFERAKGFLKGDQLPPVETVYEAFTDELDGIQENLVLVLDDYHLIKQREIHDFIGYFVSYPVGKLQLTIISRRDPPIEINQLRLFNRITEIRMTDLAFDLQEIKSLASKMISHELSNEELSIINKRVEGWVLGLQMIFMTGEIKSINEALKPTSHYSLSEYADYFTERILRQYTDDFRNIFFLTSLLARFNQELIDELIVVIKSTFGLSGNSFIKNLISRNLFIYSLDHKGKWYRYHHFFREMLFIQLEKFYTENDISYFHKVISNWFAANEYWDEAYDHALESGDYELAVSIFNKNRINFFNTDQLKRINNWLAKLPKGVLEKNLSLLVSKAVLDEAVRDPDAMNYHLTVANSIAGKLDDDTAENQQFLGEFHAVYANYFFSFERKYDLAFENSSRALNLLQDKTQYLYNYALVVHLMTLNALGKYGEAIRILQDIESSLKPEDSIGILYTSIVKSYVLAFRGDIDSIKVACKRCLPIIEENKLWVLFSTVTCYLVSTYYQKNDLHKAVKYASRLKEHYYSGRVFWELQTVYIHALALQVVGKYEQLEDTIADIDLLTRQSKLEIFFELTKAFKVDLALRQGDIQKALSLAKTTNFDSVYLDYSFYFQQLTYIRLLILTDHEEKSAEIENWIEKYVEIGKKGNKHNLLMQILPLKAIYLEKKGDSESALEALEEALRYAKAGRFIRVFVDLGEPLKHLLKKLKQKDVEREYISEILLAFEKEIQNESITLRSTKQKSFNNLSKREIETLKYVAQGLRNKEVAGQMNVSIETVKSHVKNSLQKLNVRNRVELIVKARALGIIDG